ncbi:MAG TPA: hypothetical protein VKK30_01450 [Actinomycetota bacterium]|nr:hypothetical protein [Actinomycetota bacterium]
MGEAEERVTGWFAGRIPQDWFEGPPEIAVDREEILIVGRLPDVDAGKDATDAQRAEARSGRIKQFREDTRERRMRIAREAEHRFRRKVSWGTECGDERELFTTLSLPMMTRLRMPQRQVLDTLVEAGVARSRSHALAWCVGLVAEKQAEWLKDLEQALQQVKQVRSGGPVTSA